MKRRKVGRSLSKFQQKKEKSFTVFLNSHEILFVSCWLFFEPIIYYFMLKKQAEECEKEQRK